MHASALKGSKQQPSWGPHGVLRTTGIRVTAESCITPALLSWELRHNLMTSLRSRLQGHTRAPHAGPGGPLPGRPVGQPLAHVLCSLPESEPYPGGGRGWAQAPAVEGGETLSEASLASRRHQSQMAPEGLPHPILPCRGASGSLGATVSAWLLEPRDPHCRSGGWNPGTPTADLATGAEDGHLCSTGPLLPPPLY